jgi:hypothetical protein
MPKLPKITEIEPTYRGFARMIADQEYQTLNLQKSTA